MGRAHHVDWRWPTLHKELPHLKGSRAADRRVCRFKKNGFLLLVSSWVNSQWKWWAYPSCGEAYRRRYPEYGVAEGKIHAQWAAEQYAGVHHPGGVRPPSSQKNGQAQKDDEPFL